MYFKCSVYIYFKMHMYYICKYSIYMYICVYMCIHIHAYMYAQSLQRGLSLATLWTISL